MMKIKDEIKIKKEEKASHSSYGFAFHLTRSKMPFMRTKLCQIFLFFFVFLLFLLKSFFYTFPLQSVVPSGEGDLAHALIRNEKTFTVSVYGHFMLDKTISLWPDSSLTRSVIFICGASSCCQQCMWSNISNHYLYS